MTQRWTINRLHALNARVLLVFIAVHLCSHLLAAISPAAQDTAMETTRVVYRATIIEPVLIALFVAQVVFGIILLLRRAKQSDKTVWSWVQLISGGYLAVFILNHIFLGVMMARFKGLETDFYFAAATVVVAPFKYGFIPYYALGIFALFAHLAAALHWRGRSAGLTRGVVVAGAACAFLVVGAYSGLFYDIDLPQAYVDYINSLI